jgi:hypothetical protein
MTPLPTQPPTASPTTPIQASASPIATAPAFPPEALAIQATTQGWRPVPDQASVSHDQFQDVVWMGSRFVAIGAGSFVDSVDGVTWHRQSTPKRWQPVALAAGHGGVVAVGVIGTDLASWWSSDGLTWSVARRALRGVANDVADVATTPAGWIAVGSRLATVCASGCDPIRAYTWTSTDGLRWSRPATQPSLANAAFTSVTATREGSFVAAGRKGWVAAVWTSADGKTWTRRARKTFARATTNGLSPLLFGVATRDDTLVAVGMDDTQDIGGRVRAWWSTDGVTWTPATIQRPRDGQMFSATPTTHGFLAVGPSAAGPKGCGGGIWESTDGRAWRCIAQDRAIQGFGPSAAAASATVEVAVGLTDAGYDEESGAGFPGAIWWRPTP